MIYLANGTPTTAEPSNETIEVCRSFSYKLNLANHGGPAAPVEAVAIIPPATPKKRGGRGREAKAA